MSTKLSAIILGVLAVVFVLQLCIVFKLGKTKGIQAPHPDMTQTITFGSTSLHEPKQTESYK